MITDIEVAMVTWPVPVLIGVVFLALLIGALAGSFTSGVETKKKLEKARTQAETLEEQARADAERAMRAAQVAQSVSNPPGQTLLRLWLQDDRLALAIDDQPVDTTRMPESHRKRLVSLLSLMRPWIESDPTAKSPPAPATASPIPASPSPQLVPTSPPVTPSREKKENKPITPTSIVAQVDEILQVRLRTGSLADSGIKLLESPEGGVTVMVGPRKFNSISELTDPQIQSEIRAAIAEWEKKYVPGR